MKNNVVKIAILLVLVVATVTSLCGGVCLAESDVYRMYYVSEKSSGNELFVEDYDASKYNLLFTTASLVSGDQVVGALMQGFYFGASDIVTKIEVYSSDSFTVDFAIGDSTNQNRNKLLDTFVAIHNAITHVDGLANTQIEGSDVYRYNVASPGTKLEISRETYEMLCYAREMYLQTNGAYNPAVYRLVDLWGFSSRIYNNYGYTPTLPYDRAQTGSGYALPDDKYVTAFSDSSFVDFSQQAVVLSQEGDKYYVTKSSSVATVDGENFSQWIDLGGSAKGYSADKAEELLAQSGIDAFYVDVGTSSSVFGKGYDGQMTMGLLDPFDPFAQVFATTCFVGVKVQNNSVSTSGQYVRNYTVDGVEYSHIIDGSTGFPAQTGVKSVSVIAPRGSSFATKCDALTTALTVMGKDGIVEFFNSQYVKDNNLKFVVAYETVNGEKQILSNVDKSELVTDGTSFDDFAWSVKNDNGVFVYDGTVTPPSKTNVWKIVLFGGIALFVAVGIVLSLVKRSSHTSNVVATRSSKPFKTLDVAVYLLICLVIVSLFGAFFTEKQTVKIVRVQDMETQETLFSFNVARREYEINETNGWTVSAEKKSNGIVVTFTKTFGDEQRFNQMTINYGSNTSVKMTDSLCGMHQDCVRNFPSVNKQGGAIVCSPNRLKIITE